MDERYVLDLDIKKKAERKRERLDWHRNAMLDINSVNSKRSKPVYVDGKRFESKTDAAKYMGISRRQITIKSGATECNGFKLSAN